MGAPRILLVEDNPLTRGVVREMLLSGGYEVVEAGDGRSALEEAGRRRPALVLQDMALPDMDGMDLLHRLRALLGPTLPIVALSGLSAELHRAQGEEGVDPGAGFTDFLTKPISASALLLAMQAYVTAGAAEEGGPPPALHRVLVVEGPGTVETLGFRLHQAGFEVTLAPDPPQALESARRMPPSAVVAGALLEGGDGFRLCREIRRDPALGAVPVVLVSSVFEGETGREAARLAGASALVSLEGAAGSFPEAVRAALAGPPPAPAPGSALDEALGSLAMEALGRQAARTAAMERKVAFQGAALSLLRVMADSLSRPGEMVRAPDEILARCLSAAGTSQGAAYLRAPDGRLVLSAQVGFPERASRELSEFFGHGALLARTLEERDALVLPSDRVPREAVSGLLDRLRCRSVLLAPLHLGEEAMGVLVMISGRFDLLDWADLSRSVSLEVSQSLSLGRAFSRIAASEARYRNLFESAVYGIYRTGPDGTVEEANPALLRILGVEEADGILGSGPHGLCTLPEERAFVREKHRGASGFEGVEVEWATPGRGTRKVRLSGHPLDGEDGRGGFQVFVEDVTERRSAEERGGDEERLEMVRRLARGAAHEFNNLLTAVAGHADFLSRGLLADPALREHALRIQESAVKAGEVTRELVEFGRGKSTAARPLDLHAVVEGAAPTLRRLLGVEVTLAVRRGGGEAGVFADPGIVEEALAAIAARARAVVPPGGTLHVETAGVLLDEEFALRRPGTVPGAYSLVTARMEGGTPDEEACAALFDARPRDLPAEGPPGLAAVRECADRGGGFCFARPTAGGGTTVRLYLPRIEARGGGPGPAPLPGPGAPRAPGEVAPASLQGRVVLLAEDEESIRTLVSEVLRLEGATVLEAADGVAALEAARERDGPIDLLVTDLVMPRLGGAPLAEKFRELRPGVPVLVLSGYITRSPDGRQEVPVPGARFLAKPFTSLALAEEVRGILHPAPGVGS